MRIAAIDEDAEEQSWRGLSAISLPIRLAVAGIVIGGLALAVRSPEVPRMVPLVAPTATPPAVVNTAPLRLNEPGIDPVRVEPGRIDARTGLREDTLGRGSFAAIEAPVVRIAVTRGSGAERAPGLFVIAARRAALAGRGELPLSVLRVGPRDVVETRFGLAETAEVTLSGESTRRCSAFVVAQSGLRIDGFLCGPLGGAAEPQTLACTIDALDLDDPSDPTGSAQFKQSRSRSACGTTGTAIAETVGRTASIERRRGATKN